MLATLLFAPNTQAQMTYRQRDATLPDPEGFLTAASTAVCRDPNGTVVNDKSVPDGSFVKQFTMLRADAAATLTGACDWYYPDGTFYQTQLRTIVSAKVYQYPPTLLASSQNIWPYTSTQSMDSRVSGTTSGGSPITNGVYGNSSRKTCGW